MMKMMTTTNVQSSMTRKREVFQVEDKIDERDEDEESDESMDKEPKDVIQEEEDVDPAEDSDVGSIRKCGGQRAP